jgi:hypothetical protein
MKRACIAAGFLLATGTASADEYQEMDKARVAIIAALDSGDAKAFAGYVGTQFESARVWFDSAACRKKFGNATVKAKDAKAFVACFKGLGVRAKGLLIHYGPDVSLTAKIDVDDAGKATLVRLSGDLGIDATLPLIWRDTFESHRKTGDAVTFDADAQKELEALGEIGAVFDVCVDAKGNVKNVQTIMDVKKNGPVMKQVRAATKGWTFEPFVVKGKPAPACARQLVKIAK